MSGVSSSDRILYTYCWKNNYSVSHLLKNAMYLSWNIHGIFIHIQKTDASMFSQGDQNFLDNHETKQKNKKWEKEINTLFTTLNMTNLLLSSQAAVKCSHGVEVCQTTRHRSYPYCILCLKKKKSFWMSKLIGTQSLNLPCWIFNPIYMHNLGQ